MQTLFICLDTELKYCHSELPEAIGIEKRQKFQMVLMDHCSNRAWHFWCNLIFPVIGNNLLFIVKPSTSNLLFFEFYLFRIFTFNFIIIYNIPSPLLQTVFYNLHIPFLVLITFSTFMLIQVGHFNLSIYDWIALPHFCEN